MSPRVSSEMLLVGSLPAGSGEEAFRAGAHFFGDVVSALPDGETGDRQLWVSHDLWRLVEPHSDVEVVHRPASADGLPQHMDDFMSYQLRPGVSEVQFARWPRIDEAISSYGLFRALRDEGVIPSDLRFQVGLPLPFSALGGGFRNHFASDYAILEQAYEDLVRRELERLTAAIPPGDLAIQWDIAFETLDLEGVLDWTDQEGAWQRYAGPLERLSPCVPAEVLLGCHLCYGTFPDWPMYEPFDLSLLVRMANFAVQSAGRPVDWLHVAGPRQLRSSDERFYQPLQHLQAPETRLYLGLVLPIDGGAGLRKRATTARQYVPEFGVAMYCGFGRQPGENGEVTMREHWAAIDSLYR